MHLNSMFVFNTITFVLNIPWYDHVIWWAVKSGPFINTK